MTADATLLLTALVIVPLVILWIAALFHIVVRRPDLSFGRKAIWSGLVVLVPYIGVLMYAALRPPRPPTPTGGEDQTAAGAAIEATRPTRRCPRWRSDHRRGVLAAQGRRFRSRRSDRLIRARGGTRTPTPPKGQRCLRPPRLPVSPPGLCAIVAARHRPARRVAPKSE